MSEQSTQAAVGCFQTGKLVMFLLGASFAFYMAGRNIVIALQERQPTVFEAVTFATDYDDQQWIEVRGQLAVEHKWVEPSTHEAHEGRDLVYVNVPIVREGWSSSEPVHVLATFGPFDPGEFLQWTESAASLDHVTGQLRPSPMAHLDERFAGLTFGTPLVVINEGTEPELTPMLILLAIMLLFGGAAVAALINTYREKKSAS